MPGEIFEKLALIAITAFRQNISNIFDESDFILREALFSHFVSLEEFKVGAQYLAGINIESTTKELTDAMKADIQIRCAGIARIDNVIHNAYTTFRYFRGFFRRGRSTGS